MNAIIVAALGIPTFICAMLLFIFFEETKKTSQSGYRRLSKEKNTEDRAALAQEYNKQEDEPRPYYENYFGKKGRNFNDWDLSGGTMGI
jgi:hypothetical protein